MVLTSRQRNLLLLHSTVVVWGFTGVLGELISISALPLVWCRVFIAALTLFIYFKIIRQPIGISKSALIKILTVGAVVGIHWVLFFHAIKISTVSVTLVSMSSVTLFTAILDPIVNRKRLSVSDIVVGLFIIMGIYLIFKFEFQYLWGIIFGLLAALCASVFSVFNKRLIVSHSATIITFYEMIGAFFAVTLILLFKGQLFTSAVSVPLQDWIYLLLLGVICTALAYVVAVSVMKELSTFTVALAANMEPIYGIIIAIIIFGQKETMSSGFYIGAAIIMSAVFIYPYLKVILDRHKDRLMDRKLR